MSVTDAGQTGYPNGTSDPTQPKDDRPIGELLSELTTEASSLFQAQLELAKVELREEAQKAAKAGGMFGGAGVAGLLTLFLLSWALAWGLAEIMAEGLAFLIVGVLWAIVAGVLALQGRNRMKQMKQPAPKTVETLKEDAEWLRQQKS